MTIDEIITKLMAIEEEISLIADSDEVDEEQVSKLNEDRLNLIKELASFDNLSNDDNEKRLEFARAFSQYSKEQCDSLNKKRAQTRQEIIKLTKGNAGLQAYGQVRRG